jgi:hypothetical protein
VKKVLSKLDGINLGFLVMGIARDVDLRPTCDLICIQTRVWLCMMRYNGRLIDDWSGS